MGCTTKDTKGTKFGKGDLIVSFFVLFVAFVV